MNLIIKLKFNSAASSHNFLLLEVLFLDLQLFEVFRLLTKNSICHNALKTKLNESDFVMDCDANVAMVVWFKVRLIPTVRSI